MDELLYKAKLAEQSELYEDMVTIMKEVMHHSSKLTEDQRNLFSSSYKNVVGSKRAAWRLIFDVEIKERSRKKRDQKRLAKSYRKLLEIELDEICNEVISLIDSILANKENDAEGKVFFRKMKGDYYRYMSEYHTSGPNVTKYGYATMEKADEMYQEGIKLADDLGLPSFNCIRLGLLLNYAVFYYEVKQNTTLAIKTAREAFNNALNDIEKLDDVQYKNSLEIMQLIRDNLSMWNSEVAEPIKDNIPVEEENT